MLQMDKIKSKIIRGTTDWEKYPRVQERRLKWYRHVMRRDEEYVGKD